MPNRKWAKVVEKQISESGTCVTPKCVKRCSISLTQEEMQIKLKLH